MWVKSIQSNVKRGAKADLGQRTLIVGPNGSGKSSIVNAVELALMGRASDLIGRAEVAKGIDLLALAPPDDDALWSKATLSDGRAVEWRCERNAKTGGAREPTTTLPSNLPVSFPVRAVRAALEGKAETVRAWLLGQIGASITDAQVKALIPEDLRALYADLCRTGFGTPVQVLLDTREAAGKHARSLSAEAKAAEKLADQMGGNLGPEATEEEVEAARVAVREAAAEWSATPTAAPMDPEPYRVAAMQAVEHYAALGREVQALESESNGLPAVNEDVARLRDALTRVLAFTATQRLDACLVCGGEAGHAHESMLTRAGQLTEAARRDVRVLDARTNLARMTALVTAAQEDAQRAVTAYQNAAAASQATAQHPAGRSPEERAAALRSAENTLREREHARTSWANVRAAKAQAREATARQRLYSDLRDAIEDAVRDLLERSRRAFTVRVQSFLPETDTFDLQLEADGKEVCRFGFLRNGVLHTALSGAEWARLMLALAAAVSSTDEADLSVLTPEDRAFDPDTLASVMRALSNAPGQVILCSPVAPSGRTPKGWTVIDLTPKATKAAKGKAAEDADAVAEAK